MSIQRNRSLVAIFVIFIAAWLANGTSARAQYIQFQTGAFTTTPITFTLGNVSGTVTFTGAVGSGLQSPTLSGSNLVSNFVLVQPGATAVFTFNYPLSHLDLNWGPGNTVSRTDNFVFNTAQAVNLPLPLVSNQANRSAAFSGTGLDIVSFSLSSTSASSIKLGVLSSTAPVVAPMSPIGATLLGNVVAIGMVVLYRRRRGKRAAVANAGGRGPVLAAA